MIALPWDKFKEILATDILNSQVVSKVDTYEVSCGLYACSIRKKSLAAIEFDSNFLQLILNKVSVQTISPFVSKKLPDGKKLYRRKHGKISTVSGNEEKVIDFVVPYPAVKINKVEIINAGMLDIVDFKILDTDTGGYSGVPNYVLNQFGFDVVISDWFYFDESDYDADLYLGMVIRVIYKNKTNDIKNIGINYTLHEVKD